jgi:hypothetical protein
METDRLAAVLAVIAQNAQEPPDEGIGIGLILLGVLIVAAVAVGVWMALSRVSRREAAGPPREPHDRDQVGH